jgi:hypothetical protein
LALGTSAILLMCGTIGFVLATRSTGRRMPPVRILAVSTLLQSITFGPPAGGDVRRYPRLVGWFAALLGIVAPRGYVLVERATAHSQRTETFAWLSTGQAVGNAAGSALAGVASHRGLRRFAAVDG